MVDLFVSCSVAQSLLPPPVLLFFRMTRIVAQVLNCFLHFPLMAWPGLAWPQPTRVNW